MKLGKNLETYPASNLVRVELYHHDEQRPKAAAEAATAEMLPMDDTFEWK